MQSKKRVWQYKKEEWIFKKYTMRVYGTSQERGFSQISKDRKRFLPLSFQINKIDANQNMLQSLLWHLKTKHNSIYGFVKFSPSHLSRMLLHPDLDTVSSSDFVKQIKCKFSSASCQFDTDTSSRRA